MMQTFIDLEVLSQNAITIAYMSYQQSEFSSRHESGNLTQVIKSET